MRTALVVLAAVTLTALAWPADAALIVDDFNVTTAVSVADTTVGGPGTGVAGPGSPSTEGTVMGGDTSWSRALYTELAVGDRVSTADCDTCQQGHITANANSEGFYYFQWSGPAKDLSANTHLQFLWSSDLPGAGTQAWIEVTDSAGTVSSAPVALTPGPLVVTIALPPFAGGGSGYTGVVDLKLRFDGTIAVDGNIDNVTLVRRSVDLEKLVSVDNQTTFLDADVPTGPSATPGANVFFSFVVTNDGDETLANITLTDTDFDTTSCVVPATLAPAASFTCVLGPFPAVTGQHANTATVNAVGQTTGLAVSDADPAHYVGTVVVVPSVDIEKLVSVDNQASYVDADAPTGPAVTAGANVFFRLVVTNNGADVLTSISISDTDFSTAGCVVPATLAPAASFTCVLGPFAAVNGQHANTATVNASGQASSIAVSDTDPAHYVGSVVVTPSVDIEKLVSVDNQTSYVDADAPPGPAVTAGANVFFRLVVTNNGADVLTSISVSDTDFSTTGCVVPATLAPAASFTCVLGPFSAVNGQHANTATVNASGQASSIAVSDTDPAHYVAAFTPPEGIPTLSQGAVLLLSTLLGTIAVVTGYRRTASARRPRGPARW